MLRTLYRFFMTIALSLSLFMRGMWSQSFASLNKTTRTHPFFHILARIFTTRKKPSSVPHLDSFERISERACRILGLNPGPHTLQGTNTYLLGTSSEKILVDTGEDITSSQYVEYLFNDIFPATNTVTLRAILLSHGHSDHQGGVLKILAEFRKRNLPLPTIHKNVVPGGEYPARGFQAQHIKHLEVFQVEGARLHALYTPGHTDDHVAFVLEEDEALLSGDCVLGCGTAVFDDLYSYMRSLKFLQTLFSCSSTTSPAAASGAASADPSLPASLPVVKKIYPGHGPVIDHDALDRIEEYISHRTERERQIKAVLTIAHRKASTEMTPSSLSGSWLSSWELMRAIYPPSLPFMTKISAQWNVCHHLEKLQTEGAIVRTWPDMWRIKDSTD